MNIIATNQIQAQQTSPTLNVGQLVSGLINVNIGAINVTAIDVIDVEDVLNNNEIRILNNVLNNNTILSNNRDILTDFLNGVDVNILGGQTIVGILNGVIVVQ